MILLRSSGMTFGVVLVRDRTSTSYSIFFKAILKF